ncbi:MAG: diadenylate cyclase CdaA [Clostridia bacterium]
MSFLDGLNIGEQLRFFSLEIDGVWALIGIVIDVLVVSYIAYKVIQLVQETRAYSLFKGLMAILLVAVVSSVFNLRTISFLIDNIIAFAFLAIVVIFQPEIRRALEKLGTRGFKSIFLGGGTEENTLKITAMIEEVVNVCEKLSQHYTGAIIVLEREIKLGEIINKGVQMESRLSEELLLSIFDTHTPLHDGAVIIRDDKIMAAACILPLTDNPNLSKELGTRHRAALGITEVSDSLAIVISEESGKISYANNGGLVRNLNKETLRKALQLNLIKSQKKKKKPLGFMKGNKGAEKTEE